MSEHLPLFTDQDEDRDEFLAAGSVKDAFLQLIAADPRLGDGEAARAVGRSRWATMRWKRDPEFLARYKAAKDAAVADITTALENEARRRALTSSDRLLEFLLQSYNPERFRKRETLDLGNADGKPLQVTDREAAAEIAKLLAAAQARKDADSVGDEFV